MNAVQLADAVRVALTRAVATGDLAVPVPDEITVDRPRWREHGDYATPIALALARSAGLQPRRFAEVLAGNLSRENGIRSVDVAGPGFLNIRLDLAAAAALVGLVVREGTAYGSSNALQGKQINLKLVSTDPFGTVHIGGARCAAVGDALGRALATQGATVVRQQYFCDENRSVVVKSDGDPADIARDRATFLDSRSRGFDLCIYLLGADDHGDISRLEAAAAVVDDGPAVVEVLSAQMVFLVKDREPVLTGKRAATVLLLDDLIDALGIDATTYSLIRHSIDTTLHLDPDLWTKQNPDNPLFDVQYAHARLSALTRSAQDLGIDLGSEYDAARLDTPQEAELIALLAAYPEVLAAAAELREPHWIARYLEDLTSGYRKFYDAVRVLPMGEEAPTAANVARLWLCAATRQVLANGLLVIGVSAPERM